MAERADTVHGRLLEAVHISGYTFERACSELEWLLEDGRWKQVGPGYEDINEFLGTIDLSEFRSLAERRKPLAKKLAELEATQRATAKTLGVGVATVNRDLNGVPGGTPSADEPPKQAPEDSAGVPSGTPSEFGDSGKRVAKAAPRRIPHRQAVLRRSRCCT